MSPWRKKTLTRNDARCPNVTLAHPAGSWHQGDVTLITLSFEVPTAVLRASTILGGSQATCSPNRIEPSWVPSDHASLPAQRRLATRDDPALSGGRGPSPVHSVITYRGHRCHWRARSRAGLFVRRGRRRRVRVQPSRAPGSGSRSRHDEGHSWSHLLSASGQPRPARCCVVFRSRTFIDNCPPNVVVLEDGVPLPVAPGLEIIGAPWLNKRPLVDLVSRAISDLPAHGTLRVVVGHGAIDTLSPDPTNPALIVLADVEAAVAAGKVHFVALGDRHSTTARHGSYEVAGPLGVLAVIPGPPMIERISQPRRSDPSPTMRSEGSRPSPDDPLSWADSSQGCRQAFLLPCQTPDILRYWSMRTYVR